MTKKAQTEDEFLAEARKRLHFALQADQDNRKLAYEDLCFLNGDQWPDAVKREREDSGRPCLVINKLVEKVDQVVGDQRQNKPSIKVLPVDDIADTETAEIFDGIIRNIEAQSNASIARDYALEHSTACGYGAYRVDLETSESDFFDLDIRINRIENAFTVVWDPSSKKTDKSDAEYCFVFEDVVREVFEEQFPGKSLVDFDAVTDEVGKTWAETDTIRIAEYWQRKKIEKTIYKWADGQITDFDIDGHIPVETKKTITHEVYWTKIDGSQILEPTIKWAGVYIPIIDVCGKELNIGGIKRRRGIIRHAKDPQRAYNYSRSSEIEVTALAPKTPWLVTKKMVGPFINMWNNVFKKTMPFLLFEPDPTAPGLMPHRELPAQIPTADAHLSAVASDEIKSTTGIYDASLGARSNETSGQAILQRKIEGDVSTFAYIDNLASRAMVYEGKILVDLIPKIYVGERVLRLLNYDGTHKFQAINQIVKDNNGQPIMAEDGTPKIYALDVGRYDVQVTVGPSFTTQRQEASEGMMDFVKAIPPAGQLIGDLIAKNQDWPGADDIAKRLKMMLPPNLQDEDEGETEGLDPAKVQDMIQQAVQQFVQSAEGQKLHAEMEKQKVELETAKVQLEQEKAELAAKTAQMGGNVETIQKIVIATLAHAKAQGMI